MIFKKRHKTAVVYLSTYPPRECGIATFTEDLVNAMDDFLSPKVDSKIITMLSDASEKAGSSEKIFLTLDQENKESYRQVAVAINNNNDIAIVSIQHEFGIFGGQYGDYLLTFLEAVEVPVVITFHTVLPSPDDAMKRTVMSIADEVSSIVVMTDSSKKILIDEYHIPEDKISIIPHGIHSVAYSLPDGSKKKVGFEGKKIISTFGLLSRGKGIEFVIDALPEAVKRFPDLIYFILGATHPVVARREGEVYRKILQEKVASLGLENNVIFFNKYFPLPELLDYLKATDIYISSSQNPNQAVSGTLSYALGTGRPVISTGFKQANEYITPDVGHLVKFGTSDGFTAAIIDLLSHPEHMIELGKNAYFKTRHSTWQNVAIEYSKIFSSLSPAFSVLSEEKMLPPFILDHLYRLTDDFGILQFATLSQPDVAFGYTIDDNARALMVAVESLPRITEKDGLLGIIPIYLGFIEKCQIENGTFINYIGGNREIDTTLHDKDNLEDANGRTMYALAVTATSTDVSKEVRSRAIRLLERIVAAETRYKSPRANAFKIKCFSLLLKKEMTHMAGVDLTNELKVLSDILISLYDRTHSKDWLWFEDYLTYSNAVLPEALFAAYEIVPSRKYVEVAEATLNFLIGKSFINGIYVPIGQKGWYRKGGPRNLFDQQPEDVTAMVLALDIAGRITEDQKYRELRKKAFEWFLGENILKQVVYDRTTGGCFDGVRDSGMNLNQGAESTLSYLIARLRLDI